MGSIVLLSIPEFLWGLFFILLFGVALQLLPFTGRLVARLRRGRSSPVFCCSTRCWSGAPDMFWSALKHMILPCARARHRVLADHHARAALEPARRLSGGLHPAGAAARPLRAAHPAAPRAEERDPADAQPDGRAVRLPVRRHAAGRGDLFLSRHGQSDGRCRAQRRPADHPGGRADLLRRRADHQHGGRLRSTSSSIRS